jgi:hypothetical protein
MEHGVDKAVKLRVDSAIGVNEFYSTRNGTEEFVSARRNEGGFVHVVQTLATDEKLRNTFKCDMIITHVSEIEADEEKGRDRQAKVKGYTFDYRKALIPVEFTAQTDGAIDYFLNLDASEKNPCFTQVWGRQMSQTIVTKTTTESAFGEPMITETSRTSRDFVITGALSDVYAWDDETTITVAEFKEALAARELVKADIKKRQDEYNASKAQTQAPTATVNASGFNF